MRPRLSKPQLIMYQEVSASNSCSRAKAPFDSSRHLKAPPPQGAITIAYRSSQPRACAHSGTWSSWSPSNWQARRPAHYLNSERCDGRFVGEPSAWTMAGLISLLQTGVTAVRQSSQALLFQMASRAHRASSLQRLIPCTGPRCAIPGAGSCRPAPARHQGRRSSQHSVGRRRAWTARQDRLSQYHLDSIATDFLDKYLK